MDEHDIMLAREHDAREEKNAKTEK